jgi:hypothetical protein
MAYMDTNEEFTRRVMLRLYGRKWLNQYDDFTGLKAQWLRDRVAMRKKHVTNRQYNRSVKTPGRARYECLWDAGFSPPGSSLRENAEWLLVHLDAIDWNKFWYLEKDREERFPPPPKPKGCPKTLTLPFA